MKQLIAALLLLGCAPTSWAKTWRIAVVSDMNQSYGSKEYTPALKAAIQHIRQSGTALVLSTGDMVAGQKKDLDYLGMWSAFHEATTRPLGASGIPLLPSPGNHDASAGASFANERNHYRTTWSSFPAGRFNSGRAPEDQIRFLNNVTQNWPLNYAVTMGPALFVALDATVGGGLVNNQLDWLETVLRNSEAYKVKIVFGHFPLFPYTFDRASDYLGDGSPQFVARLEAMLEKHQVDFYLSGHHHAYYPGRRLGQVRYVSVPLLGTGARYLLTAERSEKNRSVQSFLYFDFDSAGNITMSAVKSPSFTTITSESLPLQISIPRREASDCKRCGSFPSQFFIDAIGRVIYQRF